MKVLNLYAGIGGNRKLWKGIEVTAIENDEQIAGIYKSQHPADLVIIKDAHNYLSRYYENYEFIWSSPPCQKHSQMMKATRHNVADYPDMRLYQEIIFLQHFFKGKWVVENVKPYYKPLIEPTAIIGRHYFWANFHIDPLKTENIKGFITKGTVDESEQMKKWLGIKYEGNVYYKDNHCPGQVLRNCVHPEIGLAILQMAQESYKAVNTNQGELFNENT